MNWLDLVDRHQLRAGADQVPGLGCKAAGSATDRRPDAGVAKHDAGIGHRCFCGLDGGAGALDRLMGRAGTTV